VIGIIFSFDVESLFTNIPTEETINIILNRAFKDSDEFHGMKKNTLQKLLNIKNVNNSTIF
jgi:hypothetical protein